ncbi:MAG: DNA repair exonuclease [Pseudomonadota bacterium]
MTKSVCNILHTSDIHLDNEIGTEDEESPAQLGFRHVIDAALELEVDLFLLAGDLFDHNRIKQPCLEFASSQLARLHCPVVMISGNHDCMADYSIYRSYDPTEAGQHIHFIKDEAGGMVNFDTLGLRVWGRGIVEHHPGHKPLEGMPEPDFEGWNIGMTHGYYVNQGAEHYSSLITPEEIAESRFDYLALGHVHAFTTIHHGDTHAAYSGSPNIRLGAKEKTAAHIQLHPDSGITINRLVL